jgi:hypothetical protein
MYGTTAQIGNAASDTRPRRGAHCDRISWAGWRCPPSALFALSIFACAAFLTWMRRLTA